MIPSPYEGIERSEWSAVTAKLVEEFPLDSEVLVTVVQDAWRDLFSSSFGDASLRIGKDIFLPAQATGVILEKLIAVHLAKRSEEWRGGDRKTEKDIVCETNDKYSFEIKTSSSKTGLYGNRSTGHRADSRTKYRTGYYLVINYKLPTETDTGSHIRTVRFGWIDDKDWVGQAQPTGQQASIGVTLARLKLMTIFEQID